MKASALIAASLAMISFPAVSAYPDGYPRIGEAVVVALNENDEFIHNGHMRLVVNPDENEYLAIWIAGSLRHIRAQRLDGDTLEAIGSVIDVFSSVDTSGAPLGHPDDSAFDLEQIQNMDVDWDSGQQQYLLSMFIQSIERDPDDGLPAFKKEVRAGYLDANMLNVQFDQLVDLGACRDGESQVPNNSSGLRAIHVATDNSTYIFWNFGPTGSPSTPTFSGVCARRISGEDANGRPVINGENKVVLELDDKTDNGYTAFSMKRLAVEHDPAHGQFIVASVVGEFLAGFEDSYGSVESHGVVGQIQEGLSHAAGQSSTSFKVFSELDDRYYVDVGNRQQAVSPANWPVNAPDLVKVSTDPGSTRWLLRFNAVHDYGSSPPRDVFIRRMTVSETEVTLADNQASRISNNLETSSQPKRPAKGMWHEGLDRYIFPWSATTQAGAHVHAKMVDGNGFALGESFRLTASAVRSESGSVRRFTSYVTRSLDGERLFLVSEAKDSIVIQPLEFRWDDLSVTVDAVDAPERHVNLAHDAVLELEVSVHRSLDDAITNAIGTFDGNDFDVGLTILDGVSLEPGNDVITGPDNTLLIQGEPLAGGESRVYTVAVRNRSEASESYSGWINLELENHGNVIDFDDTNDVAGVSVIPLPNPNPDDGDDEDSEDDNDGDEPDPGDGDDDAEVAIGIELYEQHCAACHGSFENTLVAGKTAGDISAAIAEDLDSDGDTTSMGFLAFLSGEQIDAIAAALANVDPGNGDDPDTGEPGGENPGDEQPGDENPGDENPGGDEPGDDNPDDENPGDEQPGDENPNDENPGTEQPGDENPDDENPDDENPHDENPGDDINGTNPDSNDGADGGSGGGGPIGGVTVTLLAGAALRRRNRK